MKTIKITVMKMAQYDDLIEKYENPIEHTCDMRLGQVFISVGGEKPENIDLIKIVLDADYSIGIDVGGLYE